MNAHVQTYLVGLALLCATQIRAAISVAATVDRDRVSVGEQIALTISVSDEKPHEVRAPTLHPFEGMDLFGPYGPSTSREFRVADGQTTQRTTVSYTYYLLARRPGEIRIPALAVVVDGNAHRTRPIRIIVVPAEAGERGEGGLPISMRVKLSRTVVYQGQALIVEYALWERARARITNRQIVEEPRFTGAWVEKLFDAREGQATRTEQIVNGVPYTVMPIMRLVLFPARAGSLKIPPLALNANVSVPTDVRDFWNEPVYRRRTVTVRSPARTVTVRPLPQGAPPDFGGAVGSFRLTSTVDRTEVDQGDPVTWTVTLEGRGNLKAAGDVRVPPLPDFRAYDPQVTTIVEPGGEYYGGRKTYTRVLIPLRAGVVTIPAASFIFFDPEVGRYRTIRSEEHRLAVRPKAAERAPLTAGLTQAQIEQVGEDIAFIHPDMPMLADQTRRLWHSRRFWAVQAVPVVLVLTSLGIRLRRGRMGKNPMRLRTMEARRAARGYLKAARVYARRGAHQEAAAEVKRALLEIVAGCAGARAPGLTASQVREILSARGAAPELVGRVLALSERCDRVRYAPFDSAKGTAEELVREGAELVRELTRHLQV